MNDRDQQIETLIRLVELNNDPTWLEEFHNLRDGGYLPGGGAGSLNDWGPYYSDAVQSVWFSNLYRILRYLFDNDLDPEEISSFKAIKFRNNIRIIRCLNCDKSYQHPSSFEDHVALVYIAANLPRFLAEEQLLDSISAKALFENPDAVKYRNRLRDQYETNGIRIYDFVTAKYVCPHCGQANCDTEHDLYRITSADSGHFGLVMRNAAWRDFEEV